MKTARLTHKSEPQTKSNPFLDTITHGNCVELLDRFPSSSVDLVLTDPPYLPRYTCRDGRTVLNDHFNWLFPAMKSIYRVLRPDRFGIVFYGWYQTDRFFAAFRRAGFEIAGHLVFRKRYTSARRYLSYRHESAYLLIKGRPARPVDPISDVQDWEYTGNQLHPTQKPLSAMFTLVDTFSRPGHVVLDPFCGSGTSLLAAKLSNRHFVGFEIDARYAAIANRRLQSGIT